MALRGKPELSPKRLRPPPSPSHQKRVFPTVPITPRTAVYHTDFTEETELLHTERLRSQRYCGKSCIVGQNLERTKAVIIPMMCKSWGCETCGPRKRAALIARIEAGKPERAMTLTCPVGKFPTPVLAAMAMKAAWRKLVMKIRKVWGPFEYALVWELTKKGVPHVHAVTRGGYIAQKWISCEWDKLGIGPIVHITSIEDGRLHATHACKYLAKSNGQSAHVLAPLHVVQFSNGWDLDQEPRTVEDKYPDFVWGWDRRPAREVVRRFQEHDVWLGTVENPDGSFEIKMVPHPDPDFTEDTAEFWVAYPGIAPRNYLDE